jgi:two-component system, NarL family, response regulator LiaR
VVIKSILKTDLLKKIRIILADDHPLMRQAIRMWLEKQQDMEVIAEANDGKEAIEIAVRLQPDIVIMDIHMPVVNGMEATRQIISSCPNTEVLVLTVYTDSEHIHGILEAGASGYLPKNISGEELIQAIRALFFGETVLLPDIPPDTNVNSNNKTESLVFSKLDQLSSRELIILKLVAKGMSNKDIAGKLNISLRSVKANLSNVYIKLGAVSRTQALSIAMRSGLLNLNDLKK